MKTVTRTRCSRATAGGRSPARTVLLACALAGSTACVTKTDSDFRAEVAASMHAALTKNLTDMVQATREIQAAAPTRGWNVVSDASAIGRMRDAWRRTRVAWEQIEGAIAPMFDPLDHTMDARYEDFLVSVGPGGDPYL